MTETSELRPQQRAALIAWHLAQGTKLRTFEVAALTGLSERAAFDLMALLSATLPICQDAEWHWRQFCPDAEQMRK